VKLPITTTARAECRARPAEGPQRYWFPKPARTRRPPPGGQAGAGSERKARFRVQEQRRYGRRATTWA